MMGRVILFALHPDTTCFVLCQSLSRFHKAAIGIDFDRKKERIATSAIDRIFVLLNAVPGRILNLWMEGCPEFDLIIFGILCKDVDENADSL